MTEEGGEKKLEADREEKKDGVREKRRRSEEEGQGQTERISDREREREETGELKKKRKCSGRREERRREERRKDKDMLALWSIKSKDSFTQGQGSFCPS